MVVGVERGGKGQQIGERLLAWQPFPLLGEPVGKSVSP